MERGPTEQGGARASPGRRLGTGRRDRMLAPGMRESGVLAELVVERAAAGAGDCERGLDVLQPEQLEDAGCASQLPLRATLIDWDAEWGLSSDDEETVADAAHAPSGLPSTLEGVALAESRRASNERAVARATRRALIGELAPEDRTMLGAAGRMSDRVVLRLAPDRASAASSDGSATSTTFVAIPHCPRTADAVQFPATVLRARQDAARPCVGGASGGDAAASGVAEVIVHAGPPARGASAVARGVGELADLAWALCGALRCEGAVPRTDELPSARSPRQETPHDVSQESPRMTPLSGDKTAAQPLTDPDAAGGSHNARADTGGAAEDASEPPQAERQAERPLPTVGSWISVYWEGDCMWFCGLTQHVHAPPDAPREEHYYSVFYPEDGQHVRHNAGERWTQLEGPPEIERPPPLGSEIFVWHEPSRRWRAGVVHNLPAVDGDCATGDLARTGSGALALTLVTRCENGEEECVPLPPNVTWSEDDPHMNANIDDFQDGDARPASATSDRVGGGANQPPQGLKNEDTSWPWSWDIVLARANALLWALPPSKRTLCHPTREADGANDARSLQYVARKMHQQADLLAAALQRWCDVAREKGYVGWAGTVALHDSLLQFLLGGSKVGASAARMPAGAYAWGGLLPLPGDNVVLEHHDRIAPPDVNGGPYIAAFLPPGESETHYVLLPIGTNGRGTPVARDTTVSAEGVNVEDTRGGTCLVVVRADATILFRQSRPLRDAPVYFVTGEEVLLPPARWLRPWKPFMTAHVASDSKLPKNVDAVVCRLYEHDTAALLDMPAWVYERCALEPPRAEGRPPSDLPGDAAASACTAPEVGAARSSSFGIIDLFAGIGGLASGALGGKLADAAKVGFVEKDSRQVAVLKQLYPQSAANGLVGHGDANAFLVETARALRVCNAALGESERDTLAPMSTPRTAITHALDEDSLGAVALKAAEWSLAGELVLAAGPPCPGFSSLNQHPDGRSALEARSGVAALSDAVELLRPSYVIMENVLELSTTFEEYYAAVASQLLQSGYQIVSWHIHYGAYGAASRRKRLFMVAGRCGLPMPAPPRPTHHGEFLRGAAVRTPFKQATHPELGEDVLKAMSQREERERSAGQEGEQDGRDVARDEGSEVPWLKPLVTAAEATACLGTAGTPRRGGEEGPAHCPRQLSEADTGRLAALPLTPGSSYADLPREVRDKYPIGRAEKPGPEAEARAKIVLGRVYASRPAPSFTTQFSTQGFVGRVVHWSEARILTPAEAWCFLGFTREDVDKLDAPLNTLYECAANAVSPLATKAIFAAIRTALCTAGDDHRDSASGFVQRARAGFRVANAPRRIDLRGTSRLATMWGGRAERPLSGMRRAGGIRGMSRHTLKAKLPPGWEIFYEPIKSGKGATEGREDIKVRSPNGTVYRSVVSAVRAMEAGEGATNQTGLDATKTGRSHLASRNFEGSHFVKSLQDGLVVQGAIDARLVPDATAAVARDSANATTAQPSRKQSAKEEQEHERRLAVGQGKAKPPRAARAAKLPPGWEIFYEPIKAGKGASEGRKTVKVRSPDGNVYRSVVSAVRAMQAGDGTNTQAGQEQAQEVLAEDVARQHAPTGSRGEIGPRGAPAMPVQRDAPITRNMAKQKYGADETREEADKPTRKRKSGKNDGADIAAGVPAVDGGGLVPTLREPHATPARKRRKDFGRSKSAPLVATPLATHAPRSSSR